MTAPKSCLQSTSCYNNPVKDFAILCISMTSFFDFSMYTAGGVGLPDPPAKLAE
eukprot:CAMPEP_0197458332 /NCGR_PEP_ID=MMETSP1175-20131217/48349_1 /TAXON_ID=1003142 /ORGANISM="Triceratium dubium, Strain CCMP147" /LENGTH=53 /DNA_ID=CAMNT_0042992939 /DNA_START=24 /DNA_END=185 /DNA_ORIENTATION=+